MKNHYCHPSHIKEVQRLNRIAGQVAGVKKMIEEQRYCPDILTQLRAIRSAVNALEANILAGHIEGCVTTALQSKNADEQNAKLAELKDIYLRFNG